MQILNDVVAKAFASEDVFDIALDLCDKSTEYQKRRYGADSIEYANELVKLVQVAFNANDVRRIHDERLRM